jgi:O-antigen ligase
MFIAPSSPVKRFLHPGTGEIQAVEIRKEFWEVGWKMIKENPVTGIGLGQFALALDDYGGQDLEARGIACNTYLEYWAELGIFALLAYIGALWFSLRTAEAQRKYARALKDPFLYFSALGLQAGVIGYSIAGIFVSAEYQKLFWFVIALTCCIPRFLKHSIRERPSAQELSFQDSFDVSLDNQQIVHR